MGVVLDEHQRRGQLAQLARRLGAARDEELLVIDLVLQALERGRGDECDHLADVAIISLANLARATVSYQEGKRAGLREAAAAELEQADRAREWGVGDHVTRVSDAPQRIADQHDPYAALHVAEDDRTP